MVTEFPPFYSESREKMNDNIVHSKLKFNVKLSKELKHLIKWLTVKVGNDRPQSVEEIMNHPFFAKVDWDDVWHKRVRPPWVPGLLNHFNKKLTRIPVVNNQIGEVSPKVRRFDSRASIYFEKVGADADESIYNPYLLSSSNSVISEFTSRDKSQRRLKAREEILNISGTEKSSEW